VDARRRARVKPILGLSGEPVGGDWRRGSSVSGRADF
jgi:hypothetical protein